MRETDSNKRTIEIEKNSVAQLNLSIHRPGFNGVRTGHYVVIVQEGDGRVLAKRFSNIKSALEFYDYETEKRRDQVLKMLENRFPKPMTHVIGPSR